jgi:hypothetical protein
MYKTFITNKATAAPETPGVVGMGSTVEALVPKPGQPSFSLNKNRGVVQQPESFLVRISVQMLFKLLVSC